MKKILFLLAFSFTSLLANAQTDSSSNKDENLSRQYKIIAEGFFAPGEFEKGYQKFMGVFSGTSLADSIRIAYPGTVVIFSGKFSAELSQAQYANLRGAMSKKVDQRLREMTSSEEGIKMGYHYPELEPFFQFMSWDRIPSLKIWDYGFVGNSGGYYNPNNYNLPVQIQSKR